MASKRLENNIITFYIYLGLFQLIVGPILTIFLLQKGLNFAQIMLLQSIYSIAVFILEVPTGAIGDLLGRKVSLVMGSVSMILGITVYVISFSFWYFLLGEVFFACGMCLKSGSDTALLYDTLKRLDRVDEFTKIQGKGQFFFLFTQVIGSVAAGYMYSINPNLPLIVSGILMGLSAITAFFFEEIKTYIHEEKPTYFTQIYQSGKYLTNHKKVRAIVLYSVFFFIFYRVGFWYYQPYFNAIHIDVKYFGIIFSLFNLVAAFSAQFTDRFIKITKGKSMILLSVLMASSFLLLGITKFPIGFLFILPQQIARGVNGPVFMKYINKHIPSNQRATIISFNSLLKNLGAAIVFPIVGFLMDEIDPIQINLYSGIVMVFGIVFFYFYLKKQFVKQLPTGYQQNLF